MMLLARRNNSVSNWLNSWFNDNFFDTSLMPRMNATAPAVNVKETFLKCYAAFKIHSLHRENN